MTYSTVYIEFLFNETEIQRDLTDNFNIYTVAVPTDLELFPEPDASEEHEDYLCLTYQLDEEQVSRLKEAIEFGENQQEDNDKFFIIVGTVMYILGCNPYRK